MDIFYGIIFLVAGLMLIFSLSKENKIFYVAGAYFLIFGGWWIANALTPAIDLWGGTYGMIFKVFSGAMFLFLLLFWFFKIRKPEMDAKKKEDSKK